VGVEGRAGSLRIFGNKLEVAERRNQGDDEGGEEWQPNHTANVVGHLPGERIDAGAEESPTMKGERSQGPMTRLRLGSASAAGVPDFKER
jgi:hypothetical protein